ncbi:MAG: hypothetical protein U0520_00560 [Candidatus Saccharimonadales bacterium]
MENLQRQYPNRARRNRTLGVIGMAFLAWMGLAGCGESREVSNQFTMGVECPEDTGVAVIGSTQGRRRAVASVDVTCLDGAGQQEAPRGITLLPEGDYGLADGPERLYIDVTTIETDDPIFGNTRQRPEATWQIAPEGLTSGAVITLRNVVDIDRVSIGDES